MFKRVLEGLVSRLDEAKGVAMVGVDGIPIAELCEGSSVDLEKAAVECTSLIKTAAATGRAMDQGSAHEVVLLCEDAQTILRTVTPDYFLCLILGPGAHLGRARYEVRKACQRLEEELS